MSVATSGRVCDQSKVADAASESLQDLFVKDKTRCRLVYGVASLPLGTQVELGKVLIITRRKARFPNSCVNLLTT